MATRELTEDGLNLLLNDVLHWPFSLSADDFAGGDDAGHDHGSNRSHGST